MTRLHNLSWTIINLTPTCHCRQVAYNWWSHCHLPLRVGCDDVTRSCDHSNTIRNLVVMTPQGHITALKQSGTFMRWRMPDGQTPPFVENGNFNAIALTRCWKKQPVFLCTLWRFSTIAPLWMSACVIHTVWWPRRQTLLPLSARFVTSPMSAHYRTEHRRKWKCVVASTALRSSLERS